MHKRPKVPESIHRQAKSAAAARGIGLCELLAQVIPLGLEALEKQEAQQTQERKAIAS